MSDTTSLEDLVAQRENWGGARCTVCAWISEQPAEEQVQWAALMAGPRMTSAIWKVMQSRGFTRTESAVGNCRRTGHHR